jgi:hypothetical protein
MVDSVARPRPVRYLGVYDADGGLAGELRYVLGHLLGTAECALCDITHSPLGRRRSWDGMVAALPAPFALRHRNELTESEHRALEHMGLPVVATQLSDGRWVRLLGREELERCAGDVTAFSVLLATATSKLDG